MNSELLNVAFLSQVYSSLMIHFIAHNLKLKTQNSHA
jgi:hypothetical protein